MHKFSQGYSLWGLLLTIAILVILAFIAVKQFKKDNQLPKKISYMPHAPQLAASTQLDTKS